MPLLRHIALTFFAFITATLHAQTQIPLTDLNTTWQVQAGNNPAFASPTFDDSAWPLIHPGDTIPNSANQTDLWYRTHLTLPPNSRDFSLALVADNLSDPGPLQGCPQFFVNGTFIGQIRGYPQCFGTHADTILFAIPNDALQSNQLTVAIHFVVRRAGPSLTRGALDPRSHLLLGPSLLLENQRSLFFFRDYFSNFLRALLVCLVLIIVIAFALNLREAAEYRILIVFLIADLASNLLVCATSFPKIQTREVFYVVSIASIFADIISLIAFAEFARLILKVRRSPAILIYFVIIVAYGVFEGVAFTQDPSNTTVSYITLGSFAIEFPIVALLPIPALWIWRRRGNQDALLLTVPLLVRSVVSIDGFWHQLNLTLFHRQSNLLPPSHYISWFEVADITFLITLLLFVVVRTVRIVRARAALAAEVQAAQSVQQLLLNRSDVPTPGFHIETIYLPASEVGGDFFLVSPNPEDSSLIVVIGDVSGKGLTAAMRVAMILGVLRRETSRNPATILTNLNEAIFTQGELGFTTACCLHITPSGAFTIANAAHISPYVNGQEFIAPPSLPLGLAPDQTYETLTGTLLPNQTLVLLSDGVPEARNPAGALYGFDALPTLTQRPAHEIAQTAQTFGQEDDITVLTLSILKHAKRNHPTKWRPPGVRAHFAPPKRRPK